RADGIDAAFAQVGAVAAGRVGLVSGDGMATRWPAPRSPSTRFDGAKLLGEVDPVAMGRVDQALRAVLDL
ncbi:hypothetical protein, partial [Streptomyces sp. NBC_00199]|uniref:hypothetical protein n=1 Tax=Streptomyces sp. NBC_00199 TaxID=2975678 RepID=UPI0022526C6A